MEIGRQRHDLARHGRFVGRDQHQIDIGHATEEGFLGQQGAGQVGGDDVLIVVGPLLGGLFGNADERFSRNAHSYSLISILTGFQNL